MELKTNANAHLVRSKFKIRRDDRDGMRV